MAKAIPSLRLMFVRTPRTGSTSFLTGLRAAGHRYSNVGSGHGSALEARKARPDLWASSLKIGFVRHPMAWVASYRALYGVDQPWETFLESVPTLYDWLTDDAGEVIVDRIYRTEDMADVCRRFGIEPRHVNRTDQLDAVPAECMGLVEKKFHRELAHY